MKTKLLIIIVLLLSLSGCGMKSWFYSDDAVSIIVPLATYQATGEEISYLTDELGVLLVQMSERDQKIVTGAYNALAEAISYVEELQVNGTLTFAEASVMWDYMKKKYQDLVVVYDAHADKMSVPVRLIYKHTKRTAYMSGKQLDSVIANAEEGKLDIDMGELKDLIVSTGKTIAPLVAAL